LMAGFGVAFVVLLGMTRKYCTANEMCIIRKIAVRFRYRKESI
jgi:hypothetical protein